MHMRRRFANVDSGDRHVFAIHSGLQRVVAADLFPKSKEDYKRKQTFLGGVLSLFTILCICVLVSVAFVFYVLGHDAYHTGLSIDDDVETSMPLTIDILFPHLKCHLIQIRQRDVTGDVTLNVSATLERLPLYYDRHSLLESAPDLFHNSTSEDLESIYARYMQQGSGQRRCGPCSISTEPNLGTLVAKDPNSMGRCCETCESVKEAYTEANLTVPDDAIIPQCYMKYIYAAPGCQVRGTVWLRKAPGILLFGPRSHGSIYHIRDVLAFNPSHEIRDFTIGDSTVRRFAVHGIALPLRGHSFVSSGYSEVKYFLKVVSTTYSVGRRPVLHAPTYEYSVQWSHRVIPIGVQGQLPLVMFGFDVAPMRIDNMFQRQPFSRFLVRLCSIVGGLFVVLGIVDSLVAWVYKAPYYSNEA